MNAPGLATVAMITFNSEKYVALAIESVLAQSYTNFELVIVDDTSSDRTWEIIQSFSDPRIRSYRNPSNLGEYPNRNKALGYASGEYLIFIDGDDVLYPHGLEFMVRSLDKFPQSAMALARPWNENIIYPLELTPREFFLHEFLGKGATAINFAHILFRTRILSEVGGFNIKYRQGDTAMQLRIALEHNAVLMSDGLAWWRRTPGQASEKILQNHFGWIESLKYRLEFLQIQVCPLQLEERKIAIANVCGLFIRMAVRYLIKGKILHCANLLRKAEIPLTYWRYALIPSSFPFIRNLTSASPLTSGINKNPFYRR